MENDTARAKLGIDITIIANGKFNSSAQQNGRSVAKVRIAAVEALDVDFGVPLVNRVTKVGVFFDTLVPKLFSNLNFAVSDEFAGIEMGQLLSD